MADLIKAQIQANDLINRNPTQAEATRTPSLPSIPASRSSRVSSPRSRKSTFTNRPDESSLTSDASQAVALGLLKPVNLSGIFDLGPLNQALAAAGEPQVSS